MTPTEAQTLRALVKLECTRRNGYGSLEEYASDDYDADFETGDIILAEHGVGIIDPLVEINDHEDLALVLSGRPIPNAFSSDLITYVNTLSLESMTSSTSSCRGACTGLCAGSCITGCNGCSGECTGGCTGCTHTCGTGCAGSSRA